MFGFINDEIAERGLRFVHSVRLGRPVVRSYVHSLTRRENLSTARKVWRREIFEKNLGRRDRFPEKIVEIRAILAIFDPFERKFPMPLFGEFGRSSQDVCESDNDSDKSRG